MSISLPNIRQLFIPDLGYTIFDVDLSGADAQVVAWEADDKELKSAFRLGLDVHAFNATTVMGERFSQLSHDDPLRKKLRQQSKQCVHGTNYGGSARTISQILGWTIHETETFQSRWFSAHPGIKRWHERVELALRTKRKVTNAFGYSRTYFDRIDQLLPQALAWIPQSTVALVTFEAALDLERTVPNAQLLIQVHDSLVFQVRTSFVTSILPKVKQALDITIPYDDPLIIPWGISASTKSWGDCEDIEWPKVNEVK